MPTYDYRCNACDDEFELFQSMNDSPRRTCPKCGKRKLERLIGTGAALMFKGSGFYETDYRSESYQKAAQADKPEGKLDSKGDGKPDSKSDGKPDKKPDPKPDSKPDKNADKKGDAKPKAPSA